MRPEDACLLFNRQTGEQRQNFRVNAAARERMFAQRFGSFANLSFAGQEDEDIAACAAVEPEEFVTGVDDRVVEITFVVLLRFFSIDRAITNFDREHSARDLDHWRAAKVSRETVGVYRRRGNDELELGPFRQELLEEAEQEIDVETALVRLVDDQRVVLRERRVTLCFGEQDTVGHQLDIRLGRRAVVKTNLVANVLTHFTRELLRNTRRRRTRRDPPRLCVTDQAGDAAPQFKTNFRNLRRFSGAGFATDDDDLVRCDQCGNFGATLVNRQLGRELRFRQPRAAGANGGLRTFPQLVMLKLQLVASLTKEVAQIARHRAQTALVNGKTVLEFGFSLQWVGWATTAKR